ncbi:MAG: molybdopterin-dependent oxidoreductase, partial [Acidimicrobiales bacterium]
NGGWESVMLSAEVNVNTWRMWWAQIMVGPGTHQVFVRATDKTGYTQTEDRAGTVPDGATGWHSTTFVAA